MLGGLADELVVLLGQLPRRLDRLAAAAGEEDAVEVAPEDGELEPGMSFDVYGETRNVDRVIYMLDGGLFRATCHLRRV